jgi:protein tyrosine phosphatase (PTP) superfamily phosphohydrolase (DUF442 family)
MSVDQAYNYKKINDSLSTAGVLNEDQLSALGPEGFEAVVNLLPQDSKYAVVNERELVEQQGLDYYHIPVDFSAPSTGNYGDFVAVMNKLRAKKRMVHCAANYRVSAFYAMYAYENQDWSVYQANSLIASIWKPEDHPPWHSFIASVIANRV